LGTLLLDKGLIDEAVETFTALLNLDGQYENGHYLLGKAHFKKGNFEEAIKNLEKAVDRTPEYPDVLMWISRVHRELNDFYKAIQMLRASLEINPEYHEALFTLGLYLIESAQLDPKNVDLSTPIERIKEARTCLLQAAGLSDTYDRKSIDLVIELLEDLDQWPEAVSELHNANKGRLSDSRSLVLDGEFYLRFMFADLHKEHRSLDNYIKLLERSVVQHPDYPDVRTSLGTAYLIRCWHYFGKALEEYREAVKINPDYHKARKSLKLLENDGRGFLLLLRAIFK
jgi:tetratricopeptide (TPR) repeat protein